jgi:23S rRNA pseudouridine2605 synthase
MPKTDTERASSEKLQKVLARAGFGSRRTLESWIDQGRVTVNGRTAKLGDRVNEHDELRVDGMSVDYPYPDDQNTRRVLLYNKPEGQVCTRTDPQGRPTVFDPLPRMQGQRWVAVGRLDINTSGLLLFTTDGDLANCLMHPSSQIEREYAVRVYGEVGPEALANLKKGVMLEAGLAAFSNIADAGGEGQNHWYHVTISEGKNREVRRMWETQNVQVSRLIRVRYGHIHLPRDLRPGKWIELDPAEVDQLMGQVGVKLKKRTGLYGRSKVRAEKAEPGGESNKPPAGKRGGYLRRRRY